MKLIKKISFIIALIATITTVSCKKILEENPRSGLYPEFLSTQTGIFQAITGVYWQLRTYYTSENNVLGFYSGTDEQNFGKSAQTQVWATYNNLNGGSTQGMFNNPYQNINTLNGAIEFAEKSTQLDAATKKLYVGQAKFLRGFIYLFLVQTFGGTTATQPSGIPLRTSFVTEASSTDAPAKLEDIYAFIIKDFTDAAADLPPTLTSQNPFSGGGRGKSATSAVAKAYLAKALLVRGHSEVPVAGDFQKAADLTAELIQNQATYGFGLWQSYAQVHDQANDYGKENMFGFDVGNDPVYSQFTDSPSSGKGFNQQAVIFRWDYISDSGTNSTESVPLVVSGPKPMFRDQYNGRPYARSRPNKAYTLDVAFADRKFDSRYYHTFQTFWITNVAGFNGIGKTTTGANKGPLTPTNPISQTSYIPPVNGDTAILFPGEEVTLARRNSFNGMMVTPNQYNAIVFPTVKKFDDRLNRLGQNDFSTRPSIQMRFSEVYLMNAEANYMAGNGLLAIQSLQVLRDRAAYRAPADGTFLAANATRVTNATQAAANASSLAAVQLTPAQKALLTAGGNPTAVGSALSGMDIILDEYTRELYGDLRRWYDLTRTNQLLRRVAMYNPEANANIKPHHVRRPIPVDMINAVLTGPKYPQNKDY